MSEHVVIERYFSAGAEFQRKFLSGIFMPWVSWSYTKRKYYGPLLDSCECAYVFGNIRHGDLEYILNGDNYFHPADADQFCFSRRRPVDYPVYKTLESFIETCFIREGDLLRSVNPKSLLDSEVAELALAGIKDNIRVSLLMRFSKDFIGVIFDAVSAHSIAASPEGGPMYGDWKAREKCASDFVASGDIVVISEQGNSSVYFRQDILDEIERLDKFVNKNGLSLVRKIQSGKLFN